MGPRAMAALAWCLSVAVLLPAPAVAAAAAAGPQGSYLVRVRADATPAFDFAVLSAAIAADTKAASGTAVLAGVAAEDPPAFFHLAVRFVGTTPAQGEAAAAAFVRDADQPSSALSLRLGIVPDYAAAGAPRVRRCLHGAVDGVTCRENATGTATVAGGGDGDGCSVVSTAGGVFLVILCGATLVVLASTGLFFLTGRARCVSQGSPRRARAGGVGGGGKEGEAAVRRAGSASTEGSAATTAATETAEEQVPVTRSLLPQLSSGASPAPPSASVGDSGKGGGGGVGARGHTKQRSTRHRTPAGGPPGSTPAPPLPSQQSQSQSTQAQAPPLGTTKSVLPRPPKQEEEEEAKDDNEAKGAVPRPALPSFMRGSAPDSTAPDKSGVSASASAVEYGCGAKTPGPPPPPPPPPQAQPLKSAPKGAAAPLPPPPPPPTTTTVREGAATDVGNEGWPHLVGVLRNGRDVSYVPEAEGGADRSPPSGVRSGLACDDVSAVGYPAQPLQPAAATERQQPHQPTSGTSARHPPSGKENESVGKQSRSHAHRAPLQPAAAAAANGAPRSYDEPRHHSHHDDRRDGHHRSARHHDRYVEPGTPPTEDDDVSFASGGGLNHSYILDRADGRSARGAAAAPSAGYDRYEMRQPTAAASERYAPDSDYSRYDSGPADDDDADHHHHDHRHHDHRSSRHHRSSSNDNYLSRRGTQRYGEPPQDFARSPPVGAYDRHERPSPSGHYQERRGGGGGGGGGAFSSPSVSPTEEEEAEYQRRRQRHPGSRQQRERVVYGDESPSSAGYGPVREGREYEDDRHYGGGGGGGGRHVPDDVRIQLDGSRLQHVSYDDAGHPTAYTKRYDM